jgi:hypothetical protein
MAGMDMMMMQQCIEACSAAEQTATMCCDSMLGMGEDMATCMAMCMNMADVANTMMRMMMRPMGMDMMSMQAMLQACVAMGRACAAECMMHADMNEACAMCAEVCTNMVMACEAMMGSME